MSTDENNLLKALSDAMAGAVEKAGPSIVMVSGRSRFPASGVAFSAELVLTADHVLERDEDITIGLPDGSTVRAGVAGRDPDSDLALLKVENPALFPAEPARSAARIGQFVLALGRPGEDGLQASLGVVSAVSGPLRTRRGGMLERFLRTDAVPYPGFSGGPLVDAGGQVVGINTSGFSPGVSLTIPVDLAWKVAGTLQRQGRIRRGYLGIRSQPVELSEEMQKRLGRRQATGLLIMGIERDGSAAGGGMMVGDILVGMAGEPLADHDRLVARLSGDVVGQSVAFEVLRGGLPLPIDVVIGERR